MGGRWKRSTIDGWPTPIMSTFETVLFFGSHVACVLCVSVCSRVIGRPFPNLNRCPVLFHVRVRMHDGCCLSGPSVCQLISISSFLFWLLSPFLTLRPFNRVDSLTDPNKVDTAQLSEWALITLNVTQSFWIAVKNVVNEPRRKRWNPSIHFRGCRQHVKFTAETREGLLRRAALLQSVIRDLVIQYQLPTVKRPKNFSTFRFIYFVSPGGLWRSRFRWFSFILAQALIETDDRAVFLFLNFVQ